MPKTRLELTKEEEIRYISHLDYARTLERTIRRANLPVAYSEGFNPHMKISFASALAVGVTSSAEYLDIEWKETVESDTVIARLMQCLPSGIRIRRAKEAAEKSPALMAVVNLATYKLLVTLPSAAMLDKAYESIEQFNGAEHINFVKETPKGKKEVLIKDFLLHDLKLSNNGNEVIIEAAIKITPTGSIKPGDVFSVLVDQFSFPACKEAALIHRTGLYITGQDQVITPLELS